VGSNPSRTDMKLLKLFKKKQKKNCTTCKFNTGTDCTVGTHYAEKGMSALCYEGELWEESMSDK